MKLPKYSKIFVPILILYLIGMILALNLKWMPPTSLTISMHIALVMLTLFIWNVAFIRYYSINKRFDLVLGYAYLFVFIFAVFEVIGYWAGYESFVSWLDVIQRLTLAIGLIMLFPVKVFDNFIDQIKHDKNILYLIIIVAIAFGGGVLANNIKHDSHSEIIELLNVAILVIYIFAFAQVNKFKRISSEKLISSLLLSIIILTLAQLVYSLTSSTDSLTYIYAEVVELLAFIILAFGLLINIVEAFKYQQRARLILVNKNKQLELIDKQKDEFVGFVSHQLRTPLTAIKWRLDFMKEEPNLSPKVKEDINEVDKSNQHLIDLVKMFLSITRLNLNKYSPQIEYFSPKLIINDILKDNEPGVVIKNLQIKVECPEKLHITNDKTAITSILDNLITNAIKYCHQDGKILIECHAIEQILQIDVTDNGIGIPKQLQDNVFKPFVRLDNALKTSASGSGYGLYFISRLVQALGGIITFESEEGKGTTFEVKLPLSLNIESEAKNESKSISS